jgi:signal transduction histidine kinase
MDLYLALKIGVLALAIVADIFLGLTVYKNNPKSATNRLYFALSIVISLWLSANFLSVIPALQPVSLWLIRLSLFFATLMSALFYLFASTLPKEKITLSKTKLNITIFLTAITMLLTLTPLVFSEVNIVNNSPQPVPGKAIGMFTTVTTIFSILAVYRLFRNYRKTTGIEKRQFGYTLFAISVLLGLIISTVLVPVVAFKFNAGVSLIPLYTVIFLGITTYAIVRNRLFDIRGVIAKSITYLLVLITLTTLYGVVAFQINNLVFDSSDISRTQKILMVGLALVLAFSLQPLKRFFEKITDSIFYRDKYDAQVLLNDVSHILASEINMKTLTEKVCSIIKEQIRINKANIIVLDKGKIIFGEEYIQEGNTDKQHAIASLSKTHVFIDDIYDGHVKSFMNEQGIRASIPLHTREGFVGYLLLGEKLNGEPYNKDDENVLIILAAELAVAISNAKAYLEIQQFNVTLQQKVDDATAQLRRANEKLRALDETKDEFISMASHQLRTPLTSVKGYVSMVLEGDAGKITANQKKLLDQSFLSAQRMVYLIADLLNVSRLRTGKFIIDNSPTNLADLVEGELEQLNESAKSRNLTLTYQKPKDFPVLMLDETKIRQVVMNFADNAIYYTPAGGHININLVDKGDTIEFTVVDDGIGVPKHLQHQLFTKFYRAENAKKARPDGTGLGLFMAKKVVVAQGGSIIFKSEEGKGSTFGFSFSKNKLKVPAHAKMDPKKVSEKSKEPSLL